MHHVLSFDYELPICFRGTGSKSSVSIVRQRDLPGVPKFSDFYAAGSKCDVNDTMKNYISDVGRRTIETSQKRLIITSSAKENRVNDLIVARTVASEILDTASTFWNEVRNFMRSSTMDFEIRWNCSKEQAWSLVTSAMRRVFESIYALRHQASSPEERLWASIRTTHLCRELVDADFIRHNLVRETFLMFLLENSASRSQFEKIETLAKLAKTSADKALAKSN